MARKVQINGLANLITYELNMWSEEKQEKIRAYAQNEANKCKQELRSVDMSGISDGRSWFKTYSKNWRVTNRSGKNYVNYVVHNGNSKNQTYKLTHLLEEGHRTRNGGHTRKFVHIQPIADKITKEYYEGVERILQGDE